ncbi:MAG: transglutaminase domain-containing protein [Firmicutes bacterium]|nr:transglutaminase domain-containing protein [Bacillota bacterium]
MPWRQKVAALCLAILVFVGVGLVKAQGKELQADFVEKNIIVQLDKPANTAGANPEENLLELGSSDFRNLRVKITIKNNGEQEAKNIRLEVPLLAELDSTYQRILEEKFSHQPVEIKKESVFSRIAVIELASLLPGKSDVITVDYKLQVNPVKANFATVWEQNGFTKQNVGQAYLQPGPKIESDHPQIVAKAKELTAGLKTNLEKAKAIYDFVVDYLQYDLNASVRNKGALAALQSGTGVCEEYAALFTALARAAGIPARQVNGYADPKGTGESFNIAAGQALNLRGYRHSWAEFYLEGMGWVPVDPTRDINSKEDRYFGALPRTSHIAQNYLDQSLKVRYRGGKLSAGWEETLVR